MLSLNRGVHCSLLRSQLQQVFLDCRQHHIKMFKDLNIPETQEVDAKRLNGGLPGFISPADLGWK